MVLLPIQIAGTGNGDALGHGIEASRTLKFLLKRFTTGFQQGDIRFAVVDHFLVEMEGDISTSLVTMPTSQFFFFGGHHAIRIVKLQIGGTAHILLMVSGVDNWGRNPFFDSVELKVVEKDASGMGKKHNKSMNLIGPFLKDRTLAPTVN